MKIESARVIPLPEILSKIGLQPAKKKKGEYWYHSPFRNERTPSFKVNIAKNIWYDFGEGIGGNNIEFVSVYLKKTGNCHTIHDALRWLSNMFQGNIPTQTFNALVKEEKQQESDLVLKSVKPLTHIALIRYLESRGIPQEVASKYLKEIYIYNKVSRKEYFAAAIQNEDGGYDYRNPFFKGCIKKKAITFIRGNVIKPDGIHIFEGFMDFLSAIMRQQDQKFHEDVIVLNSLSCLREATGYMHGYGYRTAYTWLDNDEAGKKAAYVLNEFFRIEKIRHNPMNEHYELHKDVNAWHMATLGL